MPLLVDYDVSDAECSGDEENRLGVEDGTSNKSILHERLKDLCKSSEHRVEEPELLVLPSAKEISTREKPPTKNKIVVVVAKAKMSDSEEDDEDEIRPLTKKARTGLMVLPKPKYTAAKESSKPMVPRSAATKPKSAAASCQKYNYGKEDDSDNESMDIDNNTNFLFSSDDNASSYHESAAFKYREDAYDPGAHALPEPEVSRPPRDFARDRGFQSVMSSQDIVEVNLDEHLGKFVAERLKDFTRGPALGQNQKPTGQANPQSKRKHQITYLALQAKEREFDLKNQWAENKFNKKKTQSKYGF